MSGGGGRAAISIRQPTQQESMQSVPWRSSPEGSCWLSISLWHVIAPGTAAAAAAVRATPKAPISPESAMT